MSTPRAIGATSDGTPVIRRFADGVATLTSWMNSLGSVWVFALMVLVCADVFGRNVLLAPLQGVPEMLAYSMVGIVYIQLANTLHTGRFTRAELLTGWLGVNRPIVAAGMDALFYLIGAVVFGLLAWLTWAPFESALVEHEIDGNPVSFTLVVWPFRLMVFVGSAMTAAVCVIKSVENFAEMARRLARRRAGESTLPTGWPVALAFAGVVALALLFAASGPSNVMIGLVSVLFMLVMIGFGMHIGVALIVLGVLGIWIVRDNPGLALRTLSHAGSEFLRNHVFAVVPLFVLMGLLVGVSDIGRDTFDVARWALKRVKGGLGVATVAANAVFAAITGSSIASAAVFTKIATPEMMRHGYTPRFSVGVVAGTSVLGMLIPPSLLLIIYGFLSEQSVGVLFLAAIVPGIILAFAMGVGIIFMAYRFPRFVGSAEEDDESEGETLVSAVVKLAPIVVLIVAVLGGIYGGITTPAEAGAVGAAGALVIALARRKLDWRSLWSVLVETGQVTVSIMFLILAANIYSRMIAMSGLPQHTSELIASAGLGLYGFVGVMILLLIIMGMVLDSVSIMLIALPLALPVIQGMGGDLIWFGIVSVIAVEVGLLTPPVGLTCYVVKSTINDDRITLGDIFAGAFPFVLIMLVIIGLLVAVPELSLVFV